MAVCSVGNREAVNGTTVTTALNQLDQPSKLHTSLSLRSQCTVTALDAKQLWWYSILSVMTSSKVVSSDHEGRHD